MKYTKYRQLIVRISMLVLLNTLSTPNSFAEEADGPGDANESKSTKGKEKDLTLSMGISKMLEFGFEIGPIYLTDPSLFDYRRVKDGGKDIKLLLIPKNSGFTDMTIHDSGGVPRIKYLVRVTREDLGQVIGQLEELLGDIEGLRIKSVGGTVMLDGEILLPKDMLRIMRVVDALKDRDPKKKETPIRNLTTISKMTMNILAERIEREIGSPEITARVINNNLFLEGTAESNFEADRALEIARTYLPEVFVEKTKGEGGEVKPKSQGGVGGGLPAIIDMLRVRPRQSPPPRPDVKVTVNYVELNNEYNKSFNFEWRPLANDSASIGYNSAVGEISGNIIATVSSLFPKLATARDHGHARILKTQTLIAKDRGPEAGIESTIKTFQRMVDSLGNPVQTAIDITNATRIRAAVIDGSDMIELGIQITMSAPIGTTNPPTIASNSLQTVVNLKNGESAALGGTAMDQSASGYNRPPDPNGGLGNQQQQQQGGSQTPLFNFSRSKGFSRNKSQHVIFVTPEVLRSAGAGTEDITRKFRLNAGEQ